MLFVYAFRRCYGRDANSVLSASFFSSLNSLLRCHCVCYSSYSYHSGLTLSLSLSLFLLHHIRSYLIDALGITPAYLRHRHQESGLTQDFKDWQVPLGRRFRSLKLWFVLRHLGVHKLQQQIRHHVALAEYFEKKVLYNKESMFEMVAPRQFALVCFRVMTKNMASLSLEEVNEVNAEVLKRVNAAGDVMLIQTDLGGVYTIRLAVGTPSTEREHVDRAWNALVSTTRKVLEEKSLV